MGGRPYTWDEDSDREAFLYAVACPSNSGVVYFSTHVTLMRLNPDNSVQVVAGSWDRPGERDGHGSEATVNAPLCLALTGPLPPSAPQGSPGAGAGAAGAEADVAVATVGIARLGPAGSGGCGGAAAGGAAGQEPSTPAAAAAAPGYLFFGEGGMRMHVRRARLAALGNASAFGALSPEVVTLPNVATRRPISALAYDCIRGVLYMADAEVMYLIRDPLGPSPSLEPVAGHDWTDEEREAVGEFGAGPGGDGRRDGLGQDARFCCICDIMLDSRGQLYVTDLGMQSAHSLPCVRRVDPAAGYAVTTLPIALGAATSASLTQLPGNWLCVYEWGGSRLQLVNIPGLEPCVLPPPAPPAPPPDLAGLAADWGALLADPHGTGSDIVVHVGERSFAAHRLVLAARCEYFRRQFAGGCRDSNAAEVHLHDAEPEAFSQLLRHLYTGCVDFPEALLRPLLELADRLLLPRVAERAQRQLLAAATPGGVVDDLLWAERMGFGQLLAGLKAYYLQNEARVLAVAGDAVRGMMATHADLFFELHVAGVARRAGGGGGAGGAGGAGAAAALRDSYKTLYLAQPNSMVGLDAELKPHRAQQPWPGPAFVAHWGRCEPWRALTLPQRRRLLSLAASSGHAGSMDAALNRCGCKLTSEVLTAAAAAGNAVGCQRLLLGDGCRVDWRSVMAAAEAGHLPVLQLLLAKNRHTVYELSDLNDAAADGACAGGHPDILAWLQQAHGYWPSFDHMVDAARAGQVAMLELLLPLTLTLTLTRPPRPPPRPHESRTTPVPATAKAGDRDRFRLSRGLLWGPDAAAAAAAVVVDDDPSERRRGERRLRLLEAIIHGCPVEVLQRCYEPLSRGWVPVRLPEGTAAAQPDLGPARGGRPHSWRCRTLTSALESPTACWEAKLDFLLSAWGPAVTEGLVRDVAVCDKAVLATTRCVDCLQRLQRLRATGFQFSASAAERVSQEGHADALAYLWDECGVPGPLGSQDPVGVFLRGYGLSAAFGSDREVGVRLLRMLQLLATRGMVLSATHAVRAVYCWADAGEPKGRFACELALLYLAEVAEPVTERGGDVWHQAFSCAARNGAGLAVLRALRQRRGAAVDLAAVACGGSEEALD
ncbi:hypothetical protein HXX76_002827 [Chlamydomonas incerta]|uniref:BTB domain-containing protein n=1 Tax=Chlamydomonas incerta TaxID=51695 RepID=A0A835TR83_CHLIN|nr:hypothetical protein HXX76_002827 [Chlamydomonas incerta]|eukprot:KAG2442745.1 hypothetical protein HXX76_002827 [Chlamydomonas incerta]